MAAPTFDTQAGVRTLRSAGLDEDAAGAVVGVVVEATSSLVTRDMLRADLYRALWIQGAGIVAVLAGLAAIVQLFG